MVTLELDDIPVLDVSPPVTNPLFEGLVQRFDQRRLSRRVEGEASFDRIKKLLFHFSLRKEIDHRLIVLNSKHLDKIEDERFLVVIVGVNEADIRIESRNDTAFFDHRIKDAITIVQKAVKFIFGRLARAA